VSRASKLLRAVYPIVARRHALVVSVHDLRGEPARRGALGRWRARRRYGFDRASGIIAISEDIRGRIATLAVRAPISLAYPGVDTKRFCPDPLARERSRERLGLEGRQVLLTVSRLAANKQHALVIETLPALRRRFPNLAYLIVGEGSEREALATLARELGVADLVRFTGLVEDTRAYYAASDVFVMPSGRRPGRKAGEGFGIAYVEAGACGLPAVASSSGGGAEIVVDGETGRVIDPDDANALEQALAGLLADPARAKRLGEAARRRCERFDWEHGIDDLVVALRAAAHRRSPAQGLR
jgi:phosphatidylinositol alpha-1,6-mannosyltransferase